MLTGELFAQRGATFSPDRRFRYRLWRRWHSEKLPLVVVGLNPSNADELVDDPTTTRLIAFAHALGWGGLELGNVFAYRARDPRELDTCEAPVGVENDEHLRKLARLSGQVVCAWGTRGKLHDRARRVVTLLRAEGCSLWALRVNGDGSPGHPLYLPATLKPQLWTPPEISP